MKYIYTILIMAIMSTGLFAKEAIFANPLEAVGNQRVDSDTVFGTTTIYVNNFVKQHK